MAQNDGGPAFPTTAGQVVYSHGMTLRDWFAVHAPEMPDRWREAEALQEYPPGWKSGMTASDWSRLWTEFHLDRIVTWQLAYADAMIAAREAPDAE